MEPEFRVPSPPAIDIIASTNANVLLACPLKFAFRQDPHFGSAERSSPATALGNAAHEVREAAYRCGGIPLDDRAGHFTGIWDAAVAAGYELLVADWAPHEPPNPELWRRYQLTRTSSLRAASRIAQSIPFSEAGLGEPEVGTGIETWRTAPSLRLRAKIDRIDRVDSGLRVIDIKSGVVSEEPKPDYWRQLLLNAAIVHEENDEWPVEIALEPVTGRAMVFALEQQEALAAVDEVNQAIDVYNQAVTEGTIERLARPDDDTCMFCSFRTVCREYWASLQPEWNHQSVMGEITAIAEYDGMVTVTLSNTRGTDESPVSIQGLHPEQVQSEGWLACCDLERVHGQPAWKARWSSQISVHQIASG